MAKRQKNEKIEFSDSAPKNNPFAAALAGLSAPVADPDELPATEEAVTQPLVAITTRVDRKGRRGKSVTLVEGLHKLSDEERESIARDLKKALGTGVSIEGATLVVQGELSERIEAWFHKRGQ